MNTEVLQDNIKQKWKFHSKNKHNFEKKGQNKHNSQTERMRNLNKENRWNEEAALNAAILIIAMKHVKPKADKILRKSESIKATWMVALISSSSK